MSTVSSLRLYHSTVEAPVSGHPREAEKVSATGADRLRECVLIQSLYECLLRELRLYAFISPLYGLSIPLESLAYLMNVRIFASSTYFCLVLMHK